MKKILNYALITLLLISLFACKANDALDLENKYKGAYIIRLNESSATLNNKDIEEFDYTWNVDPSSTHEEVKDAPAEYYTGEKPKTDEACYIDHELYYFPMLDESKFKNIRYDGEQEYAYYYEDGENNDYIFATLPNFNGTNEFPTYMMHTAEEAKENKVLHITKPGSYVLTGSFKGQIYVDLGDKDKTFTDENAKVTIILYNANIECSVAPALVFYSVYETDNSWEENKREGIEVDTTNAGVNLIIADDSDNSISGQNIYRMLKTKYKDEDSKDEIMVQKKLRKIDAPLYSYVTMNIKGEEKENGTLTVNSSFEGLDSELHLTFENANVTINSNDDGINVNEDDVSVVTFNSSNITINAAKGSEGDGVDSNGYVVIDDSNLNINNIRVPDDAIDSGVTILYKSGNININGTLKQIEPGEYNSISDSNFNREFDRNDISISIDINEFKKQVEELSDDATLQDVLNLLHFNRDRSMNRPNDDKMAGPMDKADESLDDKGENIKPPNEPVGDLKEELFHLEFNIAKFKELVRNLDENTTLSDIFEILGIDKGPQDIPR